MNLFTNNQEVLRADADVRATNKQSGVRIQYSEWELQRIRRYHAKLAKTQISRWRTFRNPKINKIRDKNAKSKKPAMKPMTNIWKDTLNYLRVETQYIASQNGFLQGIRLIKNPGIRVYHAK